MIEAGDDKRLLMRLQKQMAGLDDPGFLPLWDPRRAAVRVDLQRYERGSTLITSNLPFDEWTSTSA